MDFQQNRAALDLMMQRYMPFLSGNGDGSFRIFKMPNEEASRAAELTIAAFGDEASQETTGVLSGDNIGVFTGNSPSSQTRAEFIADLLTNWPTFYGWMQSYLSQCESSYNIVFHPGARLETGEQIEPDSWLAVGPGFYPGCGQHIGQGATPEDALADLKNKMGA